MRRRSALFGLCALGAGAPGTVGAQAFPSRPLRMIVPFVPGGGADTTARVVAEALTGDLGQSVIVENRGGGGGSVGAQAALNAPADGYTLFYGTPGPLITNPILIPDLPYKPLDFAPVSLLTNGAYLLAVSADLPVRSVADLIALARQRPGELTYSSAGVGAGSHLAGELLCFMTGTSMVHVPYRGSGPSIQDVATGRVSFTIDTYNIMIPLIQAGKLRPVAVSAKQRMAELPDIPTIADTVPGFEATVVNYVCVRAGTPRPVIDALSRAINRVLASDALKGRMKEMAASAPVGSTPEELGRILQAESDKWREVITRANIRLQ